MIFHDIEQNSPEWHALRLGRVTSSEFKKVMTPATRKPSKSAPALMYRLLAEWMTGQPVENYENEWMERGHELEDEAFRAYECLTDTETRRGGFVLDDNELVGCSPDRFVGDSGLLEIKCPLLHTQVGYVFEREVDADYASQLQGQMLITGREWVDIFSYHPRLIVPAIRVTRNDAFIADLRRELKAFTDEMLVKRAKLEAEFGPFSRPEPEPQRESKDFLSDEDVEQILAARRVAQPMEEQK